MSYSVITPCRDCVKVKECTDPIVLEGAVQGIIHRMPFGGTHKGSGVIRLECQNKEDEPDH